ncbi:MAG: acetate--CoA ligase family protein [Deltaproteobacteria bacterium]|nr:acetate--CoA ligase family protein [Deltaproteobacteria bacterium]
MVIPVGEKKAAQTTVNAKIRNLLSLQEGALLTEPIAKEILRAVGIRTPSGRICLTKDEAVSAARQIGYPIVLKVVSPQIPHKSDAGGVVIGLTSEEAVAAGFDGILNAVRRYKPDAEIRGILVEHVALGLELIVGATRTDFGPLLLFGLGGIAVELMRDVSYRLAPLERREALNMIREIRAFPLLQGFRGQPGVDIDALADILVCVSRLVAEYPEIRELDINPLFAKEAELVVADARIIVDDLTQEEAHTDFRTDLPDENISSLFAPRSIAVVGATTGRYNRGRAWLKRVEQAGYKGNLYAVSRKEQVEHWPTFPSVSDIPERPDLVMVEVGSETVSSIARECVKLEVPWLSVHASGFGETGTEEGVQRLRSLQAIVEGTKTHLIGPNALGPYSPASGIIPSEVSKKPGHLALLSQSGVTFLGLGKIALEKDLGISKGISYGSEAGVTVDAFLSFLARDDETEIVAMYLEGVRRPRPFVAALERLAKVKPVIVLKGGMTAAGARAAASHSGALAGSAEAWRAAFVKARAVQAETFEELIDLIVAFTHIRRRTGKRVGLITPSGAAAVTYADACNREGFVLPELEPKTQERIRALLPPGTNPRNPVDVAQGYFKREIMQGIFSAIAEDENISLLVFHLAMDVYATTTEYAPLAGEKFLQTLVEAKAHGKPLAVVLPYTVADHKRAELERLLLSESIPVFASMDRCLKALAKVLFYREVSVD